MKAASMGPRLFSRGNAAAIQARRSASESFNGAATFQPRKSGRRLANSVHSIQLQWGRDFSAAEIRSAGHSRRRPCPASMGPRLFSRGNSAASTKTPNAGMASMGPRLFSRGNLAGPRRGAPPGTGFNGAATFQPRKCRGPARAAAVGPGFNGAATFQPRKLQASRDLRLRLGGFNGAATFQPRKCGGPMAQPLGIDRLQWGRDFSAAEIWITNLSPPRNFNASMGPRLFSRGNDWASAPRSIRFPRFNGAATFQPRK